MRKLTIFRFFIFILLIIAFTSACVKQAGSLQSEIANKDCAEPLQKLAFPVGEYSQVKQLKEIKPPENWKREVVLPDSYYARSMVYFDGYLWIVAFVPLSAEPKTTILKYEISTGNWTNYSTISGIDKIPGFDFIISPDQTLFGIAENRKYSNKSSNLIKYEKDTDAFEYVDDLEHFLTNAEIQINSDNVAFDQAGHLWLADVKGVYEFIPKTSEFKIRVLATNEQRFDHLQVDNHENVWFLDIAGKGILKYNPLTGKQSGSYVNTWFEDDYLPGRVDPQAGYDVNKMLLDRVGRLWLDDKGWFDVQKTDLNGGPLWYRVIRSPAFITQTGLPQPTSYIWEKPYDIFQSSDGMLWFGSSNGLVTLYPDIADWCLLSSLKFPVAEDNQHNIWAFYKNELYMYSIGK